MKPKQILIIITAIIILVIACAAVIIEDVGDAHILYRPVRVTATVVYSGAYPAPQISTVVADAYPPPPVEWYPPPVITEQPYPAPMTATPRPIPTMPPMWKGG